MEPTRLVQSIGTRATLVVTPARGSKGARLLLTAGAALDGNSLDSDLDPELHLVEATWQDNTSALGGHNASLELVGPGPFEVEVLIARGPDTSVLLDASVENLELSP